MARNQEALDLLEDEQDGDQAQAESEQTEELASGLGIPDQEAQDNIIELEDGSVVVNLYPTKSPNDDPDHYANLADSLDESVLTELARKYLELIDTDIAAREEKDKQYAEGLRKTGLGEPAPGGATFTGASKVTHPILLEASLDFAAMAIKEIVPPGDIVRTNIKGENSKEKQDRAKRKATFLNYQLNHMMCEYRDEKEAELTQLPMGGSQYMKLWFDKDLKRPACMWLPVDQVIQPFSSQNFYSSSRVTEIEDIDDDMLRVRVDQELYRQIDGFDLDLVDELNPSSTAMEEEVSQSEMANRKIEGKSAPDRLSNDRRIYHVYTWLRLEDDPLTKGERAPYILTIDEELETLWALYRNWESGDKNFTKLDWIVEDKFIPWRGAMGLGMPQIIGGLSSSATGALRALLDSAHVSNAPALAMLKEGVTGETLAPEPGQVIEINNSSIDDVRKALMPMPFNPPSPVLYQLLEFLTNAARGVISTSEEKIQELPANTSATQVLNLVESGGRVVSSIHARLHRSQEKFIQILSRINYWYLDQMANESGTKIEVRDFANNTDVTGISDPHIFSETQRLNQATAALQLAQSQPDIYDMKEVHRHVLEAMKIPYRDEILPNEEGEVESNPALENVKMALGKPAAVYPDQDHLAHMQTHLAFATDPNYGANPLIAPQYAPVLLQHLKLHFTLHYLQSMRDAVKEDADGEDIFSLHMEKPLSVLEQQAVALTALDVAERSKVLFETYMPMIAEIQKKVSEAAQNRQQQAIMADPASGALLAVEKQKMQFETENAKAKYAQEKEALQTKHQQEIAKLETKIAELMAKSSDDERIQAMKDQTAIAISALNNDSKERIEEIKLGAQADAAQLQMEHERSQAEVAGLREAQNLADSHANAMEAQGAQNQADLQQAQASAPELPPPQELAPEPPEPQLSPVAPPPQPGMAAGGLMGNFMKNELAGGDLAKQQVVDKLNGGSDAKQ